MTLAIPFLKAAKEGKLMSERKGRKPDTKKITNVYKVYLCVATYQGSHKTLA